MLVSQHLGLRNGAPPQDAVDALESLLAAIAEGRHEARLPEPFRAPFGTPHGGFPDPDRLFDAWAPYMTRRAAREGLDGLRERALNRSASDVGPSSPGNGP